MEEVRQSHRRESRQGVGAVQGVVDPFGSPPLGSNYRSKTLVQTGGSQRGFRALAPRSRYARRLLPGWSRCSGGTTDPGLGVCSLQGRNAQAPAMSSPWFKQRGRHWRAGSLAASPHPREGAQCSCAMTQNIKTATHLPAAVGRRMGGPCSFLALLPTPLAFTRELHPSVGHTKED